MDDLCRRVLKTEAHHLPLHRQLQRLHATAGIVTQRAIHLMVLKGITKAHDAQDLLGGLGFGIFSSKA
ncbi:MAG: hypothetical protein ACK55I_29420 [bacterium]